ncbi:MAG: type II secretion system F family protein [bacterium]|nr:type II secretion system F family protein [bacterium]
MKINRTSKGPVSRKDLWYFTHFLAAGIDAGVPTIQALYAAGECQENPQFRTIIKEVTALVGGDPVPVPKARSLRAVARSFVSSAAAQEADQAYLRVREGAIRILSNGPRILQPLATVLAWRVARESEEQAAEHRKAERVARKERVPLNLSQAFARYPQVFDPFYVNLVAAGEMGGILDRVLTRLADYLWFLEDLSRIPMRRDPKRVEAVIVAQYARTLGTLLSCGVPILDAFDIVASVLPKKYEQDVRYVREQVASGKNMADPMMETRVFPLTAITMIAIGEQTGAMDTTLRKLSDACVRVLQF